MLRISRGVRDNCFNLTQQLQQNLPTFDPNSTSSGVIMSTWQEDPELFLYKSHKEGSALHLWRRERTSSSRPLTRADFSGEIPVPVYGCLVRKGCAWRKSCFEALEEYISPRHFLVNCEGLVYVELFQFSEDEKIDDIERIYLRLHDVLNMEAYGFTNPKIPFRTVEYIEGGEAATLVDPSPNELKLKADLIELTFQLKASLKELEKEKSDKEALEKKVDGLEAEVTCLENKATALSAELDTRTCEVATLMNNLDQEMRNKRILEDKVADVESKYKILADNEKKLTANLEARSKEVATLQQDLKKEKSHRQELESRVDNLQATIKAILASTKKNPPKGNETKTTSDLDHWTCVGNETKTTSDLDHWTCVGNETKPTSDLDHWTCVVQPLQQELNQANDDKRALGEQVAALESKNKTLTTNQTKLNEALAVKNKEVTGLQKDLEKEKSDRKALEKKIAELEAQVKELLEAAAGSDDDDDDEEIEKKEAWMNDHKSDDWVGFEELQVKFVRNRPVLRITKEGASFSDDNTTNVKADNFYLVFSGNQDYPVKVVNDKDLATNGEKARYDPKVWGVLNNAGEKYAARFKDDE